MKNIIVIAGSLVVAIAFNFFLIPHGILSSGISGIAILVGLISPLDVGFLNFVFNLPLLVLGYVMLGKKITYNTLLCVISLSIFLAILPVQMVSNDILLSALLGGFIAGIGIGIILKYSGTSGGIDIVAMILSRRSNAPVGLLLTGMNGVIVLLSGTVFGWSIALYTLVSIYITGKVIDTIYTDDIKVTMQIITTEGEAIRQELLNKIYRGFTMTDGTGGFSKEEKQIIWMVVTRYEMLEIKKIVRTHDEHAFVNIFKTIEVDGQFAKNHTK